MLKRSGKIWCWNCDAMRLYCDCWFLGILFISIELAANIIIRGVNNSGANWWVELYISFDAFFSGYKTFCIDVGDFCSILWSITHHTVALWWLVSRTRHWMGDCPYLRTKAWPQPNIPTVGPRNSRSAAFPPFECTLSCFSPTDL